MLYMNFDWNWPRGFREEKVDDADWADDAGRPIIANTISSSGAFGSGELIKTRAPQDGYHTPMVISKM